MEARDDGGGGAAACSVCVGEREGVREWEWGSPIGLAVANIWPPHGGRGLA